MISTKKAIMLGFITTLIFSIILFGSATLIASKFLRLTTQGRENFNEFIDKLEEVQNTGQENIPYGFMLILDEDTGIMAFEKGKYLNLKYSLPPNSNVILEEQGQLIVPVPVFGGEDSGPLVIQDNKNEFREYNAFYSYPKEQCKDKDCLVLCRSRKFIDTLVGDIERIHGITGDKIVTHRFNREYICENLIAEPIDQFKISRFGYLFREKGDDTRRFPVRITKSQSSLVVSNE